MSQPVKISDNLLLEARVAAEASQRSIAGQVEFWARLGRTLDELMGAKPLRRLARRERQASLGELLGTVDTPEGQARLKAHLDAEPYPHFEPHPERKGILIRIEADGSRSVGRFVNRQFVAEAARNKPKARARAAASAAAGR